MDSKSARTPAQWYCLLIGAVLTLVGILGFAVDATFETGGSIDGDELLGFEVNGIHNLVHVISGLALLAAAGTAPTAKTMAITFGVVYALVTLVGLVDGRTVFGVIPVNGADNVLHLLISAVGIAAGLSSKTFRGDPPFRRRKSKKVEDREQIEPTAGTDADTESAGLGTPGATGRFAPREEGGESSRP